MTSPSGKPADPLAVSVLLGKGYTPSQIAAMTKVSSPKRPVDPLAVSMLLGKGYTAAEIAAMTGGSIPVSARRAGSTRWPSATCCPWG